MTKGRSTNLLGILILLAAAAPILLFFVSIGLAMFSTEIGDLSPTQDALMLRRDEAGQMVDLAGTKAEASQMTMTWVGSRVSRAFRSDNVTVGHKVHDLMTPPDLNWAQEVLAVRLEMGGHCAGDFKVEEVDDTTRLLRVPGQRELCGLAVIKESVDRGSVVWVASNAGVDPDLLPLLQEITSRGWMSIDTPVQ